MLVGITEWTSQIEGETITLQETKKILCTDWCKFCTTPMDCDQDFTGDLFGPHEECETLEPLPPGFDWFPIEGPPDLRNIEPVGSTRNCRPTGEVDPIFKPGAAESQV
jgi:hypothetical protein